jgi:hypothetical protein
MIRSSIHSNQFIIASVYYSGKTAHFSVSDNPVIHESYSEALKEAQRLASKFNGKKFVVLAIAAIAELAPVSTPVITTYSL